MSLRPVADRLIVRRIPEVESLIALPENMKTDRGVVLAAGPGAVDDLGIRRPMTVRPGDTVFFSRHGQQVFRHEGEELMSLREIDVIAYAPE